MGQGRPGQGRAGQVAGSRYSYQYGTSSQEYSYISRTRGRPYCRCGGAAMYDAAAMSRSPQQSLYSRRQIGYFIYCKIWKQKRTKYKTRYGALRDIYIFGMIVVGFCLLCE